MAADDRAVLRSVRDRVDAVAVDAERLEGQARGELRRLLDITATDLSRIVDRLDAVLG